MRLMHMTRWHSSRGKSDRGHVRALEVERMKVLFYIAVRIWLYSFPSYREIADLLMLTGVTSSNGGGYVEGNCYGKVVG